MARCWILIDPLGADGGYRWSGQVSTAASAMNSNKKSMFCQRGPHLSDRILEDGTKVGEVSDSGRLVQAVSEAQTKCAYD